MIFEKIGMSECLPLVPNVGAPQRRPGREGVEAGGPEAPRGVHRHLRGGVQERDPEGGAGAAGQRTSSQNGVETVACGGLTYILTMQPKKNLRKIFRGGRSMPFRSKVKSFKKTR